MFVIFTNNYQQQKKTMSEDTKHLAFMTLRSFLSNITMLKTKVNETRQ